MLLIDNIYANNDNVTVTQAANIPKSPDPLQSGWINIVPIVLIFVVFYFLLIRPQEKRRKEHEQFISTLKKGEQVVTNSGIYGMVVSIDENNNTVILEVAPEIKIKILKTAVADIISRKEMQKDKASK